MKDTPVKEEKKIVSVLDIMKRLNKDKAEEDKIKVASDYKENYFERDVITTGSPYLNYRISREIGRGGMIKGALNLLIGGEGSGKTSVALLGAADEQKQTGKYVAFYDGEGSLNQSYLDRFGVDKSKFIYYKGRNLETMLDTVEALSTAEDVGMIIIDSIPIFNSSVVEEKSAGDNTIGIEAKRWGARMSIIEGNCSRRNIALVCMTFYKLNPGSMGDPRTLPRGEWQRYMSNLSLEFTKKELIKGLKKEPIGHIIDVRIKKSKLQEYDAKDAFQINFYYADGFNQYDEYASVFIETGVVLQGGGGNYSFADEDGVEIKVRGKSDLIEYFKNNQEHFDLLLKRVNNGE